MRKRARKTLSIDVAPAVVGGARPHSARRLPVGTEPPRRRRRGSPDLRPLQPCRRGIQRSAIVEDLRQLRSRSRERASPFSAFSLNRSRAASCVDTRLALPCSLSLTGTSSVRLTSLPRLRTAFLPAARVARFARLEPAVSRRALISDLEVVFGALCCHESAPSSVAQRSSEARLPVVRSLSG